MTVTGNTTFTFPDLTSFGTSEALSGITVNVKSSARYKLYIAGVITSQIGSSTNTIIPINTFTVSATNRGTTSPATITLADTYLQIAQGASTNGRNHVLTITRNALNTFTQAPGGHVLTLHIRFCQY
ncbi:MAG: hypothetical protein H7Y13_13645 [Sphingobacteriaceae bacterium]|nr:hypothetical protein [Sphingobacteriaceae bacterium]